MRLLLIFAILASIVSAFGVSYVAYLRIYGKPDEVTKSIAARKKECDSMMKTAHIEEDVYGQILSGSIANHIPTCNYCMYVRTGDPQRLVAHRADTRRLIEEHNERKRASNAA